MREKRSVLLAPTTIDVVSYCASRCWFRVIVARPGINPFSVPEFLPCLADLPDWEAVIVRLLRILHTSFSEDFVCKG